MKLHISYNVFDGEELLRANVEHMRHHADTISVVFQQISHYGNPCTPYLVPLIKDLIDEGLIDRAVEFAPPKFVNKNTHHIRHKLEMQKRYMGFMVAKESGATHYMSMDVDEFYEYTEMMKSKHAIEEGKYDTSACHILTYHANPNYVKPYTEKFYVPLIHSTQHVEPALHSEYFCYVDPTRGMFNYVKPVHFPKEFIKMHHFTATRLDLHRKYANHNAAINFIQLYGENYESHVIHDLTQMTEYVKDDMDTAKWFRIEESIEEFKERYVYGQQSR